MAKVKATKETTKEITFHCKFCGESKPLSEMTFMTNFFPVLVACRSCDKTLQNLKLEEEAPVEPIEETAEEEALSDTES
jgi:transcription elongation factor Elf1